MAVCLLACNQEEVFLNKPEPPTGAIEYLNYCRKYGITVDGKYIQPAGELKWHPKLQEVADLQTKYMYNTGFALSTWHNTSTLSERFMAVDYPRFHVADILSRVATKDTIYFLDYSMRSTKMRAKIMGANFNNVAISRFARPRDGKLQVNWAMILSN